MLQFKRILFLSSLIFLSKISAAQVSYYGNDASNKGKLSILKNTTTLFTLQYANYAEIEKFDEAIKKSWTITPYKIIKPDELASYNNLPNYSFFYFDVFSEQLDSLTKVNICYALKLVSPSITPKQRDENVFALVTLFGDVYTNMIVNEQSGKLSTRNNRKAKLLNTLYNTSRFANWSPGFLLGYLKQINDGLIAEQNRGLDYQFYNKVRLPELATETLYVPEYVREIFSSQSAHSTRINMSVETYNYKLKFLPAKTLDSLILNKGSKIKYLIYTQQSNDKIISIYDSKDDAIIYQKFSFQSPSFEMSDLIEIKNIIKSVK